MNNEEKAHMEKLGITYETKIIYRYKQHQYNNLKDALNYARLELKNDNENSKQELDNE